MMKIEICFSTIFDADEPMSRAEAFDAAEMLAGHIRKTSGLILEVQDVEPVTEYDPVLDMDTDDDLLYESIDEKINK